MQIPKQLSQNHMPPFTIPKVLGSWGTVQGAWSSCGATQYHDGLGYDFLLPLEASPKTAFPHTYTEGQVITVMVFRRFPMTSSLMAFSDITILAGVYGKANILKTSPKNILFLGFHCLLAFCWFCSTNLSRIQVFISIYNTRDVPTPR